MVSAKTSKKTTKRVQEAPLTMCGITQALDSKVWDWSDAEKQSIINENPKEIAKNIYNRLAQKGWNITAFYAIVHDSDSYEVWDEGLSQKVIDYKTHHIHCLVKFADNKQDTLLANIANAVGISTNYVEKPKSGRYSFDNMLAYLVHAKHEDKYQYAPSSVITLKGEPYSMIYADRHEDWLKSRVVMKAKKFKADIDWLVAKILTGEITKQQILLTDEYYNVYALNSRQCDDAFNVYGQRKAYKSLQALKEGKYRLTVLFVKGESGQGKTRFANSLINKTIQDAKDKLNEDWTVYNGATANVLDDYNGDEIIFLDDLRGNCMSASDWLRLLDPYNASPAKARYRNKAVVASRCIIITATQDPTEYFYYVRQKGDISEALDQFIRRITACVKVYNVNDDGSQVFGLTNSRRVKPDDLVVPGYTDGTPCKEYQKDGKWCYPVSFNSDKYHTETHLLSYGLFDEVQMNRDDALDSISSMIMDNNAKGDIDDTKIIDSDN